MLLTYPVIFTETNDNKETVLIEVPDIENALSEGFGMRDAIFVAKELIYEMVRDMIEDGEEIPEASNPDDIDLEEGHFFDAGESTIMDVTVDVDE